MHKCNPSKTPVDTESKLVPDGDPVCDPTLYRNLAGALQYQNLSYVFQQVCLYMHDLRDLHYTALKRIMLYERHTIDHGLQLHVSSTAQLTAYTDADWAGCPRQVTLSRSSAEAEYRGVANVVAETAVVYLSTNPIQHQRTKHIEIDIHFVCDYVASGQVRVLHVPSRFQYADRFTKGLPSALCFKFRFGLNVRRPHVPTAREY
nr:ribonuclease H-like domain-containing protein [Tanacetum cinerariifolium]